MHALSLRRIKYYQGKYYFYIPAQFIGGQLISDTTLISMGMESHKSHSSLLWKERKTNTKLSIRRFVVHSKK
jgi:hypothetical protein